MNLSDIFHLTPGSSLRIYPPPRCRHQPAPIGPKRAQKEPPRGNRDGLKI